MLMITEMESFTKIWEYFVLEEVILPKILPFNAGNMVQNMLISHIEGKLQWDSSGPKPSLKGKITKMAVHFQLTVTHINHH